MSDDPFLSTIASEPDLDGPRLVYADWLEERGDTDRAEFIRRQCAIEGLDADDPAYVVGRRRCQELLDVHQGVWLGPLADVLARSGANAGHWFRRGFVDTVILPAEMFLDYAVDLFAIHPVRNVTLTDAGPWLGELSELPQLARLSGLGLSFAGEAADADAFHALFCCPQLARIEAIGIYLGAGPPAVEALCAVPSFSVLRLVRLAGADLGDSDVRRLTAASCLRGVTHLDLDNNEVGPDGVASLAVAPALADLVTLRLDFNPLGEEGAVALAAATGLPLLTELFLRECDLGDDGAAALCLRMIGRRLTALGAAGNDVTADGAGVLAVSNWPCLTRLDLSENPIEDNGARFLAVAPGLANLAELALNDCGIGADGVAALADSVRLPGLRRLELDGSAGPPISEEAAAELARGPISGGLTRLTLRRRRLTEAARQLLRRRFGPRLHLDA